MKPLHSRLLGLAVVGTVVIGIPSTVATRAAQSPAVPLHYTTYDLGTLGGTNSHAVAVNNGGLVVGVSDILGDASSHAFVWRLGTGMVDLGTFGGTTSAAVAVNDDGLVVGFSYAHGNSEVHGFAWTESGGMVDLGANNFPVAVSDNGLVVGTIRYPLASEVFTWTQSGGFVNLGRPGGMTHAEARAINSEGTVVGVGLLASPQSHTAIVWTPTGGWSNVGALGGIFGELSAINEDGLAAGWAAVGEQRAVVWTQSDGMVDIGHGVARAVSDSGIVVGAGIDGGSSHGFAWTSDGGMLQLPSLGGNFGDAKAVNDIGTAIAGSTSTSGEVTTHAFVWTESGGTVDLSAPDVNLSEAEAVNNEGTIVGRSWIAPTIFHATVWATDAAERTAIPLSVSIASDGTVSFACPLSYATIGFESFKGAYPDTSTHSGANTLGPSLVCSSIGAGYGTMENGYLNGLVPTQDGDYWVRISKNGTQYVSTDFSGEWYYWTAHRAGGVWTAGGSPTGTISVTTNLPGASFTIMGPVTYTGSGTSFTQSGAPPGTYTITYDAVGGYVTPPSDTQILTAGGTLSFTGAYSVVIPQYCVSASVSPSGSGSILTSAPGPCHAAGTAIALTAQAEPGYVFIRWSGDATGQANPLVLSMAADLSITAEFDVDRRFLVFPLRNKSYLNATITSVFDHSGVLSYCPDDIVTAYTGEVGRRAFGNSSFDAGFPRDCDGDGRKEQVSLQPFAKDPTDLQPMFLINGHYSGGAYLAYDGHPGYDFRTTDQMPNGDRCSTDGTPCPKRKGVTFGETAVLAAAEGDVICVNPKDGPDPKSGCGEGGGEIKIRHTNARGEVFFTIYLHLNLAKSIVGRGKHVLAGEQIAVSGDTGAKGQPHLHFEVRSGDTPIDPYGWNSVLADPYTRAVNRNLWLQP